MALRILWRFLTFLLCFALSSHSTAMAADALPAVTQPWAPAHAVDSGVPTAGGTAIPINSGVPTAGPTAIPMQAPSGEGAPPAELRLLSPIHTPAKRTLNPSIHLVVQKTPLTPSAGALHPHESEAAALTEQEAQGATFGSHAGPALPLLTELPVGIIEPAPGARGVNARGPAINFTSLDLSLDLPQLEPNPLATVEPQIAQNGSRPKPAVCSNNPQLTVYEGAYSSAVCRAYLYLNTARTSYNRCTAWFADPTHAVLAGHCIADGGSARYKVVAVNGRYGTVCCNPKSNTGPDNCERGYGLDIIQAVAASGWFYSGRNSNDGGVLKLRRSPIMDSTVGQVLSYQQPIPYCPSGNLNYVGWVYPERGTVFEGCNQAWKERLVYATTPGAVRCTTTDLSVPSLMLYGSSCGGMSGSPLSSSSTYYVWGILTQFSINCTSGKSITSFTAISNGNTTWGVYVANLILRTP